MDSPQLPQTPRVKPKELPLHPEETLQLDLPLESGSELGPLVLPSARSLLNFSSDGAAGGEVDPFEDYTPAQLHDLNQQLFDDSVPQRPLIDEVTPISELRAEYESGSATFVKQIDSLEKMGFNSVRRARGDGDCFYRSLGFAYIESLMGSSDPDLAVGTSLSKLSSTVDILEQAGNEKIVFELFLEALTSLIENIVSPDPAQKLTKEGLLSAFQIAEISNSIVMYLRLLTSSEISLNHAKYKDFINMGVEAFGRDVQVLGREADHVEIQALSRALELNIDVAYLTGSGDGSVDFIKFRAARDPRSPPLVLLYRPGHYDILPVKSKV